MKKFLENFWRDEEGATAIEYGLIAGLIAVGLVAVLTTLGTEVKAAFQTILDGIVGAKPKQG